MKRKVVAMLLTVTMVASMLVGCGGKKPAMGSGENDKPAVTEGEKEKDKEKEKPKDVPVLNFYMMNSPVTDFDRIMDKANAIIEEKIGAKLNLVLIDSGTYAEKMNLMINSGDDWDLAFTAS